MVQRERWHQVLGDVVHAGSLTDVGHRHPLICLRVQHPHEPVGHHAGPRRAARDNGPARRPSHVGDVGAVVDEGDSETNRRAAEARTVVSPSGATVTSTGLAFASVAEAGDCGTRGGPRRRRRYGMRAADNDGDHAAPMWRATAIWTGQYRSARLCSCGEGAPAGLEILLWRD